MTQATMALTSLYHHEARDVLFEDEKGVWVKYWIEAMVGTLYA